MQACAVWALSAGCRNAPAWNRTSVGRSWSNLRDDDDGFCTPGRSSTGHDSSVGDLARDDRSGTEDGQAPGATSQHRQHHRAALH